MVKTTLPMQGAWVLFLVGKLISSMLCGAAKKKKKLCILMITQGSVTFIKTCAEKIHDSFRTVVSSGQGERTVEWCVRITLAVLCFFR